MLGRAIYFHKILGVYTEDWFTIFRFNFIAFFLRSDAHHVTRNTVPRAPCKIVKLIIISALIWLDIYFIVIVSAICIVLNANLKSYLDNLFLSKTSSLLFIYVQILRPEQLPPVRHPAAVHRGGLGAGHGES